MCNFPSWTPFAKILICSSLLLLCCCLVIYKIIGYFLKNRVILLCLLYLQHCGDTSLHYFLNDHRSNVITNSHLYISGTWQNIPQGGLTLHLLLSLISFGFIATHLLHLETHSGLLSINAEIPCEKKQLLKIQYWNVNLYYGQTEWHPKKWSSKSSVSSSHPKTGPSTRI